MMGEQIRKILKAIAWIALIVGIIMILWRIFGNSPTDLAVIVPFIIFGLAKIWEIDSGLKDFKHEIKLSFGKVREDLNKLIEVNKN